MIVILSYHKDKKEEPRITFFPDMADQAAQVAIYMAGLTKTESKVVLAWNKYL